MKVFVAQVSRGVISVKHLQALDLIMQALKACGAKPHFMRATESSLLHQSRSIIATRFHQHYSADYGYDVLLWIDDDMVEPDVESIVRMCAEASERETIVGAVSMQRRPGGRVNTAFPIDQPIEFFGAGKVLEVGAVGTGLCAVSGQVFKKLAPGLELLKTGHPAPNDTVIPFYDCIVRNETWLGEDISFCHLARECGFQVFADTRVRIGHLGEYSYHVEDSTAQWQTPRFASLRVDSSPRVEP